MAVNKSLLARAKEAIDKAVRTLDDRNHKCGSCGLTVYDNRAEYQTKVELEAMSRKLNRIANAEQEGGEDE